MERAGGRRKERRKGRRCRDSVPKILHCFADGWLSLALNAGPHPPNKKKHVSLLVLALLHFLA